MAGCWKPLPNFLEKRGLLEMRQKGVSGPAEYPRARTALGLPRRGTLVTGGSFVPVKQEKPGGSQCCERNIHQSPRCAQQLAAPSDCGRGISPQWFGSVPRMVWSSGLGSVPRMGWDEPKGSFLFFHPIPHSPSPALPSPCQRDSHVTEVQRRQIYWQLLQRLRISH